MKTRTRTAAYAFFVAASLGVAGASASTILVSEAFGGLAANNLNGTTADTFNAGLVTAGGSAAWVASSVFKADGSASANRNAGYLTLGTYINDAKNTDTGKFVLTTTITMTTGSWLSIGFSQELAPSTTRDFTNTGSGTATNGMASMLLRTTGDIDSFGGGGNANQVNADDVLFTTTHTLRITLDFSRQGGYDGTTNFGTATFAGNTGTGGAFVDYGSFTYASNLDFRSLLITGATGPAVGQYSNLSLVQIPEPSAALLVGMGLLALLRRRR